MHGDESEEQPPREGVSVGSCWLRRVMCTSILEMKTLSLSEVRWHLKIMQTLSLHTRRTDTAVCLASSSKLSSFHSTVLYSHEHLWFMQEVNKRQNTKWFSELICRGLSGRRTRVGNTACGEVEVHWTFWRSFSHVCFVQHEDWYRGRRWAGNVAARRKSNTVEVNLRGFSLLPPSAVQQPTQGSQKSGKRNAQCRCTLVSWRSPKVTLATSELGGETPKWGCLGEEPWKEKHLFPRGRERASRTQGRYLDRKEPAGIKVVWIVLHCLHLWMVFPLATNFLSVHLHLVCW